MHRSWIILVFLLNPLLACGGSTTAEPDESREDLSTGFEDEGAPDPSGIGRVGEESGDWRLEGAEEGSESGEETGTGGILEGGGNESGEESGDVPGEESGDIPGEETGDIPGEETGDIPGEETGDTPGEETGDNTSIKGCDGDSLETFKTTLTFPSVGPGCPWGQGANLSPADYLARACISQEQTIPIPDGKVLCSLSASVGISGAGPPSAQNGSCEGLCCNGESQQCSPNGDCFCDQACANFGDCCDDYEYWCLGEGGGGAPFGYDDHFVLTFEESVLVASTSSILQGLEEVGGSLFYDWEKLKNTDMFSNNSGPFCHAQGQGFTSCSIPADGGQPGPLSLDFTEEAMASTLSSKDSSGSFQLIVVGDNDPSTDCYHSGMSIDVTATIAPAP